MARRPATDRASKTKAEGSASPQPKTARTKPTGTQTGQQGTAGSASADQPSEREIRKRLQEALIAQTATLGWGDLSYAEIVEAANIPLAAAYRVYRSKVAVLMGLIADIDQQMLAGLETEPLDGSVRDKLFDLVMRRLDLQEANKTALETLLRELPRNPAESLCVAGRLNRSMALLLDLAGASTSGLRGLLRIKGMTALYLNVVRAWCRDETDDSAATMSLLDKRLNQAERLLGLLHRRERHRK